MLSIITENNRRCSICSAVFKNPRGLLRHLRTHFPNEKTTSQCNYCDFVFTKKDNITRHLRLKHGITKDGETIDKPLTKPTPTLVQLSTGGDLIECTFCPDAFKSNEALRLHMLRQHKQSTDTKSTSNIKQESTELDNQSIIVPQSSSYTTSTCNCGRTFLRLFDYRQHIMQYHKADLDFFEHECNSQQEFEELKVTCRLKHYLFFTEEQHLDGSKYLVFRCLQDGDSNLSCTAKLSVFNTENGFLINGILTHFNHELPNNPQEKQLPKIIQKLQDSINNPVASTSQISTTQKPVNKSLSLDLFSIKPNSSEKTTDKIPSVNKKISLDLFNVGPKKSNGVNVSEKSKRMSLDLFNLAPTNKDVNKGGVSKPDMKKLRYSDLFEVKSK